MKIFMSSANVNVQEDRVGLEGSGADHGGSHPGGSYHASALCWLECRARSLRSKHWVCMVLGLCAGLEFPVSPLFVSLWPPYEAQPSSVFLRPFLHALSCRPNDLDYPALCPCILSTLAHKCQCHPPPTSPSSAVSFPFSLHPGAQPGLVYGLLLPRHLIPQLLPCIHLYLWPASLRQTFCWLPRILGSALGSQFSRLPSRLE